jgi:cytosine/adenosine deaminase-related metal-dependent hydrolase
MILKNVSVLLGPELEYNSSTNLQISKQRFKHIKKNINHSAKEEIFDCEGLLVIPGLVNSHTHIGDSIAKDVTLNDSVNEKIHPIFGAKPKILKKTKPSQLASFMQNTCKSMIRKGITTFVDFREGGLEGVQLLKQVMTKVPIRSIILGRVEYYQKPNQIRKNIDLPLEKRNDLSDIIKKCDGIGVSGANENSNSILRHYSTTKKLRAIHSAETKETIQNSKSVTRKSETLRALQLKPHFLVHMTYASKSELIIAAKKTRGIVICPRANGVMAEGVMDYLWKVTMAISKKRIDPKQILKMATVNAGKILQKNIGMIKTGNLADCVLIDKHSIDLDPIHNIHASLVHRTSDSSIRAVMIGGKIVFGKI